MGCLENFIKWRAIPDADTFTESVSKLYFDDLPGLSLANAEGAVEVGKYKDAVDLCNRKMEFSAGLVMDEILARSGSLIHQTLVQTKIGHMPKYDQRKYDAASAVFKGLHFRRGYSQMTYLYLHEVEVLANSTVEGVDIKVLVGSDPNNPESEVSKTVDLTAGVPATVSFDQRVGREFWLVMDNTDVQPLRKTLLSGHSCGECGDGGYPNLHVKGWDGTREDSYLHGLLPIVSVRCDKEVLFCSLKSEARFAILYRTGSEILEEYLATDRLNLITLHGEEWAEEKVAEWLQKSDYYLDVALRSAGPMFAGIDQHCVECGDALLVTVHG